MRDFQVGDGVVLADDFRLVGVVVATESGVSESGEKFWVPDDAVVVRYGSGALDRVTLLKKHLRHWPSAPVGCSPAHYIKLAMACIHEAGVKLSTQTSIAAILKQELGL